MIRKTHTPLAALAGLALAAGSAHGALLVYEGFDYTPAFADPTAGGVSQSNTSDQSLTGKGGTTETGLSGTWANAVADAHDLYLAEGSLAFGDLQASGNHVRYNSHLNSDRYSRELSVSVSGGGEIWFSFLANRLQNNNSAGREGIAIANGILSDARFDQVNATGLQGFGIASISNGTAWTAYGWDGATATVGSASFAVPTDGSQTNLLVGRIQYNAGPGDADVFSVYHYDRAFVDGNLTADMNNLVTITSIEVNVNEALLNTLNVTRQVNTAFDEIRIGTTLDSVIVAIPEPSTALLGGLGMLFLLRRRR